MSESGDIKRSREVEEGAESATEQLKSESEEPGREKGQPDNNDFIQTLLLEEKSNDLAHERKWESAKEALEKLSARPCDTKLRLKLISIECSLELEKAGNKDRVKNDIEELKKIMLQYKCPDIESVNKLVNYYITKKRYIRALVLVQCIHDVYQHKTSSLEVLGDIQIYILYMVNNIVGEQQNIIHESWKITTSLGDLLSLPSFEGVDDEKKNIDFTVCQNFLGSIFNSLGMYSKVLQNSETAMKLAEEIESGYFKNTVLAHSFQNCLEAMDKMGHETEFDMYNDKLHVTKENLKKYEKEVTKILSLELTERYLRKSDRESPPPAKYETASIPDTEQPFRESISTSWGASGGFTSINKDDSTSKSKLRAMAFKGMRLLFPCIEFLYKTFVSPSIEISSSSTSRDEAILPSEGKPAGGGLEVEQPNISPVSTSEITSTTAKIVLSKLKLADFKFQPRTAVTAAIKTTQKTTIIAELPNKDTPIKSEIKDVSKWSNIFKLKYKTPGKKIKPKQIPFSQKTKKATEARTRAEFAGNLLLEEPIEVEQQDIQNYADEEGETENLLEEIEREIVESIKKPASIRKRIGEDGGKVELLGCSMHFPLAALKKETDIEISVDTNPENFPKDCILVSPVLRFSPSMKFNKRVMVEMELSCILQKGQQIELLCKKRGSASGWRGVETTTSEDSSVARFYLDHFCSYFVSIKQYFGIPVLHKFINDVYMRKDTGLIVSVFSKNRKIQADSDLRLKEKQFMSILPLPREIKVQKSESLKLKMISNEPKNTEVRARQSSFILVDEDFLESRQGATREFKHCPALDKKTECNIDIDYEIQKFHQDGTKYPNPPNLVLDSVWPIESMKKEDSKISVNVKNENNSVKTLAYTRGHAKSELTLKDSTLDIQ